MKDNFRVEFALKNFVWFLIFCFVCALCIGKILYPQIESYKKQALESRKSKIAFAQVEQDHQALKNQLKSLSMQNYSLLSALYRNSDENALLALLQDKFSQIQIQRLNTTQDNAILNTRYQIVGYAPNTQAIEDFILYANTMPYFVRAELPIKMELDEKNSLIYFSLLLSIRHSDYTEHPLILENGLRFDKFKP